MTKARDRADRTGSDPIRVGNTVLETDSNNDLVVKDTSNAQKKVIASEVHLGTGTDKVILKRSSTDGKLQLQTTDGTTTSNSEVSSDSGGSGGSGGGTTSVYANIAAMTATSPSAGDQALVTANSGLYVYNGNGWYKVATVNTSPTISSPSTGGSFALAIDGTATTIELVGADVDEGTTLQNSYAVTTGSLTNGGGATATVTTSSTSNGTYTALNPSTNTTNRFFKVTPTTNTSYAGSFTLTFSVSDGINAATTVQSFSLEFTSYGSAYFDGTDDYLTVASSSDFALGTGDFTIECWVNFSDTSLEGSSNRRIFSLDNSSGNAADKLQICIDDGSYRTNGDVFLYSNSDQGYLGVDIRHEWHHICVSRSSGTLRFFLDGVQKHSASNTQNYSPNSGSPAPIIGSRGDRADYKGYISNFRIVVGTAVYTSDFTVPTSPLTVITNTKLLTAHKNNAVTDGSDSNHTITKVGNATEHASSPFSNNTIGYGSLHFDGTGDYLATPTSTDLVIGTNDFTIEYWAWSDDFNTAQTIFDRRAGHSIDLKVGTNGSGQHRVYADGSYRILTTATTANTWNHVVLQRSSNVTKMFLNGTEQSTTYADTNNYTGNKVVLGMEHNGYNQGLTGYISNFRMVVGSAVYSSNFTPSTTPLTAITNTKLLTAQRSTPLNVTSGSTRFDGTNDKLSVSSTNIINSLANFTVEAWAFFDVESPSDEQNVLEFNTGTRIIFGRRKTDSGLNAMYIYSSATGDLYTNNAAHDIIYNRWVHLAWVKQGQNFRMYIDGKNVAGNNNNSATNMAAYPSASLITIGMNSDGNERMDGYLSNVRISSTARYSADFATPTSAFSNDSDTILLTCQNSSGSITDASSNNHTIVEHGGITGNTFNVKFIATDQSTSNHSLDILGNTRNALSWPFNYSG